jgi:hypothetical protein
MKEFVYVLTNSWFPGLAKLGSTSNVENRLAQLSHVLPGKSEMVWQRQVRDAHHVEQSVREILSKFAVANSYDWFACPSSVIVDQFRIFIEAKLSHENLQTVLDGFPVSKSVKVDNLKSLGEYCRRKRKTLNLSLREFADMCGVGVRFVSEFERGKGTCQFDLCQRIAQLIGVDLFAVSRDDAHPV